MINLTIKPYRDWAYWFSAPEIPRARLWRKRSSIRLGIIFQAYSAGSRPTGIVNPMALEQISELDLPADMRVRSKSWEEFCGPDVPELDLLLTVCDNAAGETCPAFAGDYQHIHWGFPDPAGSSDNPEQERAAFASCCAEIKSRVERLVLGLSATDTKDSICRAIKHCNQ